MVFGDSVELKTGGYTRIVDWWAFGCVAHELMTGHTPFCKRGRVRRRFSRAAATPPPLGKDHKEDSHYAIYLLVIKGRISFPSFLGATPKSLVKALLKAGSAMLNLLRHMLWRFIIQVI